MLVSISYGVLKKYMDPEVYVNRLKSTYDVLMRNESTYKSKIETVNNRKFLITSQHLRDNIIILFYGLNDATLTSIRGSVQCAPEDETEANATLHELLNNSSLKY